MIRYLLLGTLLLAAGLSRADVLPLSRVLESAEPPCRPTPPICGPWTHSRNSVGPKRAGNGSARPARGTITSW
ncbi:hypothetical protein D3C86_2133270 [compost metagenome]